MTQPRLARWTPEGRVYDFSSFDPTDTEPYASSTTIIGSALAKEFLGPWNAKLAAGKAWEIRHLADDLGQAAWIELAKTEAKRQTAAASERGTAVHELVERHSAGEQIDLESLVPDVRQRFEGYLDLAERFEFKVIASELTVFRRSEPKYAGTLDMVVEVPCLGGRFIADVKTGSSVYSEVCLQLASYRFADTVVVGPPWRAKKMGAVDGGLVIHLGPTGAELVPVECGRKVWEAFAACCRVHEWVKRGCADAIGAPVHPGVHA